MAIIKIIYAGGGVEKKEPSYNVDENVYNVYNKLVRFFSQLLE